MAATWVILGPQGTYQYNLIREKALGNLLKTAAPDHPLLRYRHQFSSARPESLDCFHNGTGVLKEVTGWHVLLRNSCRKTDTITPEIIDLIDQLMLLEDPESRIDAQSLHDRLKAIVESATAVIDRDKGADPPEVRAQRDHMEMLLKEIDRDNEAAARHGIKEASPEHTRLSVSGLPVNRGALKARITLLSQQKTSHRFDTTIELRSLQIIPEAVVELPAAESDLRESTNSASNERRVSSEPIAGSPIELPTGQRYSRAAADHLTRQSWSSQLAHIDTGVLHLTRSDAATSPRPKQNIIQARELIEQERDRGTFGGMRMLRGKPNKDAFLKHHFVNRDIVSPVNSLLCLLKPNSFRRNS